MLEIVVAHLHSNQLECLELSVLDEVVVDCHDMKLGQFDVGYFELLEIRESDKASDKGFY